MTHNKKQQRGFTFVEMLVVVAVVGIISALMVVNFRKSEEGSRLQRSAQLVLLGIRKAQNFALSSAEFSNAGNFEVPTGGYIAVFNKTNNTYFIIYADFNGTKNLDSGETIPGGTVNLEKGIIVDFIKYDASTKGALGGTPNECNIIFTPPDALLTLQPPIPPADEVVVTIKKSTGASCSQNCQWGISCASDKDCKAIKVSKTGLIKIVK